MQYLKSLLSINPLLGTNSYLITIIVAIFLLAIVILWWQVKTTLFWKNLIYSLPLIGKVSIASRQEISIDDSGWLNSEKGLCEDFYTDVKKNTANTTLYDRANNYLGKVGETGRNELSVLMWGVLISLVFIEALGFGYILSGYTLPGASEKLQWQGALGIAGLISSVLVILTHTSGAELHKRTLIEMARNACKAVNEMANLNARANDAFSVRLENDNKDDNEKTYIQILNRLGKHNNARKGFPFWTVTAAVVVTFVAITATIVRYDTYVQNSIADTMLSKSPVLDLSLKAILPNVITAPQKQADRMAKNESQTAQDTANLTTFAILAVLFIMIQLIGVGFGYNKGFAGRESRKARRIIGNFDSRTEYESWYRNRYNAISQTAQKLLSKLQIKLNHRAQDQVNDPEILNLLEDSANRTFMAYCTLKQAAPTAKAEVKNNTQPLAGKKDNAETKTEREARIRAELKAEAEANTVCEPEETDEQMRERLKQELGLA